MAWKIIHEARVVKCDDTGRVGVIIAPGGEVVVIGSGEGGSIDTTALENSIKKNAEDIANRYTKTETDNAIIAKIAEIVANAPEDLNTLKELADWIDAHEDSASAMNSAIKANAAALAQKLDASALTWGLIPAEYSTLADYIMTLPKGRHLLFFRNAADKHITDMPLDANMFIEVLKYSETTMYVNAYPSRQVADAKYSRAYSGNAWGAWYKFTGTAVE